MPLELLVGQFSDTKARIDTITADLRRVAVADETTRRLQAMPGIGLITASVLTATLPDVPRWIHEMNPAGICATQPPTAGSGPISTGNRNGQGHARNAIRAWQITAYPVVVAVMTNRPTALSQRWWRAF